MVKIKKVHIYAYTYITLNFEYIDQNRLYVYDNYVYVKLNARIQQKLNNKGNSLSKKD